MRLESDYLVPNRELFMSIILNHCPSDSELEIEGKLPNELKESVHSFMSSKTNRYVVNNKSREKLYKVFVEKDKEITNNLLGLHLYLNTELMFRGFHFYDYGSDSQSGRVVFFHKEAPETLIQELLNKNAMQADE